MIELFKPKEGGTASGNILRAIASNYSDGQLGQGDMKIKPGETQEEYFNRMMKAAGAALSGWQSTVNQKALTNDPIKEGYILQLLKNYSTYLLILPIPIYLLWKLSKKMRR